MLCKLGALQMLGIIINSELLFFFFLLLLLMPSLFGLGVWEGVKLT